MGAVKSGMWYSLGAVRVDDPSGSWDCHSPTGSVGWLVGCHQLVLGTDWSFLQRYRMACLTVRKNLHSSLLTAELFTEPSTLLCT